MRFDIRHVIATLATVAALVALVAWTGKPPAAKGAGAPPTEFSAARALDVDRDLTALGPHGMADPETTSHRNARETILGALREMGLSPEVHAAPTCPGDAPSDYRCESIRNVVAVIRGSEGPPALMLSAHYDSVHRAPGAADDGVGTSTVIEIARALLASGVQPKRDVVLLLDDGEEIGLLGARAFVEEDPIAKDVRVVLNFEARGTSGPAAMFETSEGAAWLVDLYARAVERPVASSILYALYKSLPNDTDLTVFKKAGMQGLNFALADEVWHYHTPKDDLDHLDPRSVQHMGDQGLAVTRGLMMDSLDERPGGESVYFELFSRCLVRWRSTLVWPLEILALLSLGLAIAIAIVNRRTSIARVAVGAGCALVSMFAAWASSSLVALVVALHGRSFPMPVDPPMRAWVALIACAVAAGSVALFALARGDDDDAMSSWIGALVAVAALSLLFAAKLPAGSYLFTLPVLFGALFVGISARVSRKGRARTWVLWVLAAKSFAVTALLWFPFVRVLLVMVGAGVPAMTVLPVAALVVLAAPLVVAPKGWTRAVIPAIAGAIALGAAMAVG
jgi:hypothetical protein